MNNVSVVIVNWNTGKLLAQCVKSLLALPDIEAIRHIIIVDNASSDNSLLISQHLKITLLAQYENLGFAKAVNIGINYIKEHEGSNDHILLLNPDTEVQSHAIEHMANIFSKDNHIGIVGATLKNPDGTIQESVRTFPSPLVLATLFLKLHLLIPRAPYWQTYMMHNFDFTKEQVVDQVMGAGFLIRNALLKHIGLLDESFWIWFEEVDYCKRAITAGWHTLYIPNADIIHYGGVSFHQKTGLAKTMPLLNSALVYANKHLGTSAYIVLLCLYPFALCIALLASVAHMYQRHLNKSRL